MNDMFILEINLKRVREEKGLSISELSRITGISKSSLHYIENNKTNPTLYTLCQIAINIGVEPCELYTYRSIKRT